MSDEKLRMCAYYFSFDETGCREVDLVLSAVACAGKAYHHTDMWSEHVYDGEPSQVERIQAAASAAAATIADLRERVAEHGVEYGSAAEELEQAAGHLERMAKMPDSSINKLTYAAGSLRQRANTLRRRILEGC